MRRRNLLESPLSWKNYNDKLHLLLCLEELQMEVDIKRYNIEEAVMTKDTTDKKLLVLEVKLFICSLTLDSIPLIISVVVLNCKNSV